MVRAGKEQARSSSRPSRKPARPYDLSVTEDDVADATRREAAARSTGRSPGSRARGSGHSSASPVPPSADSRAGTSRSRPPASSKRRSRGQLSTPDVSSALPSHGKRPRKTPGRFEGSPGGSGSLQHPPPVKEPIEEAVEDRGLRGDSRTFSAGIVEVTVCPCGYRHIRTRAPHSGCGGGTRALRAKIFGHPVRRVTRRLSARREHRISRHASPSAACTLSERHFGAASPRLSAPG